MRIIFILFAVLGFAGASFAADTYPDRPIRVEASTSGNLFTLSIANAGARIPEEVRERLFQPFFRGAIRPSRNGLGLGLYIASEIARAHDGTLDVTSNEAETRFTFSMPKWESERK